jgi:flagellar biosynthesis/type III secretory pathway chaperone
VPWPRSLPASSTLSSYGDLLAVLRQQSDTVSHLIELTTAERRAIAERDLAALTAVTAEKTIMADRLQDLEGRRRDIAAELSGPATGEGAPPTLRELLERASGPEAEQLRLLASTLPTHVSQLGEEARINRQLVMSALGIVNSALDFLRPLSDSPSAYGPARSSVATAGARAGLDRRA